jgi:tripartite-type tricarboxylate transporter receptor subunit TctC
MRRRTFLAAAAASLAVPSASWAFATRPVRIIVPYAAGGPTDRYAREFANRLAPMWGQPVVILNKPGGSAALGASEVAAAAGDGHTLLLGSLGMVTNQILFKSLPYDPAALAPLSRVAIGGGIFYVHHTVPVTTARELQAWGLAHPGGLKFGSSGIGSTPHLTAELFAARAGVEIIHVPYRGSGPAMNDLVAGHINAMADSPTSMRFAQAGHIRPIAIATPERNPLYPEVPTMRESGFDVVGRTFYGFFCPSGTPPELQQRISADLRSVAAAAEVRAVFQQDGLEPSATTAEEFRGFLGEELAKWTEVVRSRNIQGEG